MRKKKILRAARQKKITHRGTPIRLSADFSAEVSQDRGEWNDIFKILKDKTFSQEYSIQRKYPSVMMEK